MSPSRLFILLARAEAVTWAMLLSGMVLKYATETTELGVQIAGPIHGVVFIAYVLTAVVVGADQRWSTRRLALAVGASIPPLATIPLERYAARHGWLAPSWRLEREEPAGPTDRVVAWMLRHPGRGALAALGAVAVLTAVALIAGPPGG
ncbi:hypothetical protein GCM10027020_13530 [Nocardioides salsibiostraticola]